MNELFDMDSQNKKNNQTVDQAENSSFGKSLVDQFVPLTIAQITVDIKSTLENKYNSVLVQGEVSNYKKHTSGHHYFSLIDGDHTLQCVCWRGINLPNLIDGMSIICTGKITAYTGRSQFQLVVSAASISGKGNLFKLFEELKTKLEKEGLFDIARKRPIPSMPKHIGIITAATGDAIQDILIRLQERVSCKVTVWSVQVQGPQAPGMIAQAIKGFNEFLIEDKPDVLIITRGGGSMEDLWAFNDEITVRAVSNSGIPTVTAVGHEMDVTLVDYVSDKRSPTPTASIEMLLPKRLDLEHKLLKIKQIISTFIDQTTTNQKMKINAFKDNHTNLLEIFSMTKTQKLDYLDEKIKNLIVKILKIRQASVPSLPNLENLHQIFFEKIKSLQRQLNFSKQLSYKNEQVNKYKQLLESFSYEKVLQRGFCMATKSTIGEVISTASQAIKAKEVTLQFQDNSVNTIVDLNKNK